jgi:O-antigen ligase
MGLLGKGKVSIPALRDENDFCLYINTILPLAFFIGQLETKKYQKLFFNILALTLVAANVATNSRGGFLGLVAVGLFIMHRSHKKLIGFLFIGLVSIGVLVFAPGDYWQKIETIQTQGAKEGTGKHRIEYWKAGLKIFLDFPLFGVGPRNYGVWVPQYHAYDNAKKEWGRVPHSLYIDLLSEMGLIGAIVFFSILRMNVKCHRRIYEIYENSKILSEADEERDPRIAEAARELYLISLGLSGAMIAYLVTGAFISVLWYGYFWSITALWLAAFRIAEKLETLQYAEKESSAIIGMEGQNA